MGIGMMTSSNGSIFRVTGHLCGEFTGPGEFPAQRPMTRSFDAFFHVHLNKQLSKQPRGWWFETPPWSLWRQRNGVSPGVRMQPVVADLQEGHGDPNQASQGSWRVFFIALGKSTPNSDHPYLAMPGPGIWWLAVLTVDEVLIFNPCISMKL